MDGTAYAKKMTLPPLVMVVLEFEDGSSHCVGVYDPRRDKPDVFQLLAEAQRKAEKRAEPGDLT